MPPHLLWLLQRECHQRITQWLFFDLGMAAGGDHNILLSLGIQLICDGHGMAIGWELSFPQLLASFYVEGDRKSTRLNSSHLVISYAVFCLKKKNKFYEM